MSLMRTRSCWRESNCGAGVASLADWTDRLHHTPRRFSSSLAPPRRHSTCAGASSASTSVSVEATASAFVKQLLSGAVGLVSSRRTDTRSNQDVSTPCTVSYAENNPNFRPMSAAARLAFAALEEDDEQEQQAALGALCLVTYSDEEGEQSSRAVRAFSALNALQDSRLFGAVSEDDADLAVGVMETLCIVSYSEDDE